MAERGLDLAHAMILRWLRRYAPELIKRWNSYGKSTGRSRRVDETFIKVRGEWILPVSSSRPGHFLADLRLSKKVDAEEPYSAHQKNIAPALMVILGIRWLL